MQIRAIQRSKPGTYSRDTIRTLVRGVHVLETSAGDGWEVRTLGENGRTERFATKDQAIEFALQAKKHAKIIVHQRQPKKVTVAQVRKAGNRTTIQESELR